ncbi:hypothetical protein C8Q80DRAFT_890960 [Daedaleopsis nitida]|nr:hypothetical protein C8Q80DRAFT_890960 [Daedaleopsis nitida]
MISSSQVSSCFPSRARQRAFRRLSAHLNPARLATSRISPSSSGEHPFLSSGSSPGTSLLHTTRSVAPTSNQTLSGGTDIPAALTAFFPQLTPGRGRHRAVPHHLPRRELRLRGAAPASRDGRVRVHLRARDHRTRRARSPRRTPTNARYNQPVPTAGTPPVATFRLSPWTPTPDETRRPRSKPSRTPTARSRRNSIAYWLSFVRAGDPNTYKLDRSRLGPQGDRPPKCGCGRRRGGREEREHGRARA